jgi:hypothetical protein
MSKGFLVVAQNTKKVDYVRQAYALALSVKISQKEHNSFTLMTNDPVPEIYRSVFDYIVPIPWFFTAEDNMFAVESRWKIFHTTPYDETIVLDSDMLLLDDVSVWWKNCSNKDLKFCSNIVDFRGKRVVDTVHRKAFTENNLSNPYFALHYFKKSQLALDFYKTLEFVIKNWEYHYTLYSPKHKQTWASMDLSTAIAIEVMGIHEEVFDKNCPLELTHMKSPLQGWDHNNNWTSVVHHYMNDNGELFVSNIKQQRLFHYIEKDFITDDMISKMKGALGV